MKFFLYFPNCQSLTSVVVCNNTAIAFSSTGKKSIVARYTQIIQLIGWTAQRRRSM